MSKPSILSTNIVEFYYTNIVENVENIKNKTNIVYSQYTNIVYTSLIILSISNIYNRNYAIVSVFQPTLYKWRDFQGE